MKKKIFFNLVMGTALIATPALLLASCSAQSSDVKLPITVKDSPDDISIEEINASTISLATVQKLFIISKSDFNNVTLSLKNGDVGFGQTNQVVLTANNGFIFENGANILESVEFTLSNKKILITVKDKDTAGAISVEEINASPITFTTIKKLFNINESDFNNVTLSLKNGDVGFGQTNQVVLTANNGFIFENGANILESVEFTLFKQLLVTVKDINVDITFAEVKDGPLTLATVQKLFNINASDFSNVTAALKGNVGVGQINKVVLTAINGFIFENGTNTLESKKISLSNIKILITAKDKDTAGAISVEEINASPITFTTIKKLFNINESDFENVIFRLKNDNVGFGQTNQLFLISKPGFIFENCTNILGSVEFTLSNTILSITAKDKAAFGAI